MAFEFLEAVCNEDENTKREEEGMIGKGFTCRNVRAPTTLYRDIEGVEIAQPLRIVYRAGCELRCTTSECARATQSNRKGRNVTTKQGAKTGEMGKNFIFNL